jgi:hypothetical protein
MAEGVQGYLVVTVVEASGKSRDDTYVWDDATKEGYVKGEFWSLRESTGAPKPTARPPATRAAKHAPSRLCACVRGWAS